VNQSPSAHPAAPRGTAARASIAGTDEAQLLARARDGDAEAFGELVVRHRPRMVQLLTSVLRDASSVDDVVQESCIRAFRAVGQFRGDASFYTWFYRIGINTAFHHLRRARAMPTMLDIDAMAPGATESIAALCDNMLPESRLACRQIADTVLSAMTSLPQAWRTTIMLRDVDAMSYADIASTMQCSPGTVRSRIARSRAVLSAALANVM
jgi:RNA polymerase sigma-70 factor (ECF subfamily)